MSQPRDHHGHTDSAAVERYAEDGLDVTLSLHEEGLPGHEREAPDEFRAALARPRNDRKMPYTDAELDILTDDFILGMADTAAWRELVAEVGEHRARDVLKQRLAGKDPNNLINW